MPCVSCAPPPPPVLLLARRAAPRPLPAAAGRYASGPRNAWRRSGSITRACRLRSSKSSRSAAAAALWAEAHSRCAGSEGKGGMVEQGKELREQGREQEKTAKTVIPAKAPSSATCASTSLQRRGPASSRRAVPCSRSHLFGFPPASLRPPIHPLCFLRPSHRRGLVFFRAQEVHRYIPLKEILLTHFRAVYLVPPFLPESVPPRPR